MPLAIACSLSYWLSCHPVGARCLVQKMIMLTSSKQPGRKGRGVLAGKLPLSPQSIGSHIVLFSECVSWAWNESLAVCSEIGSHMEKWTSIGWMWFPKGFVLEGQWSGRKATESSKNQSTTFLPKSTQVSSEFQKGTQLPEIGELGQAYLVKSLLFYDWVPWKMLGKWPKFPQLKFPSSGTGRIKWNHILEASGAQQVFLW